MPEVDYTMLFAHVHKQSNIFLADRLKELGVNVGQFPHLMRVCATPGLTQDEIAEKTRTDKSTVAKMLKQLDGAGFVTRKGNPGDKRSLLVFPTQKALDVYPAIMKEKRRWHEKLTGGLTATERHVLDMLLAKIAIE